MTFSSDRRKSCCSRRRLLHWWGFGTALTALAVVACQPAAGQITTEPSAGSAAGTAGAPTSAKGESARRGGIATAQTTSSVRGASSPTADALARLNYLHTDGATIRDASGKEVTLSGVNWFGMETDTLAPHGLWARSYTSMLDQIVQLGYNCIRLPFSNELFDPKLKPNGIDYSQNADLKGLNGLQIMDKIVVEAGKRGLKILLDQHRPTTDSQSALWYTDELTQQEWIAQWQALAKRYLGNDTVFGADLHNEPSGPCTWGSGDPKTDWAIAAELCGNALLDVNPHWLIFVEGIEKIVDKFGNVLDWTWQGGELINARTRPIELKVPNQLIYSPHDYGPSVYNQGWFTDPKFPDNLPAFWDFHWGYLHKQGKAPIVVGEFGGPSVGNDPEGKWQRALVSYLKANKMNYTYWAFNGNSADTGGLLKLDWHSINQDKQDLLKTYQGSMLKNVAPSVVDVKAVPIVSNHIRKLKALHYDATGVEWTDVLKPELYVLNKTLDVLDLSNLEVRYWFAPNGNADPSNHQVQITGTSTANFGTVLSPDKVRARVVADTGVTFAGNPVMFIALTFAPGTIAETRNSVGFGLHVQKKDGTRYFQPSHYSYRDYHWPSEWERVGIYQDGKLVWGVEPQTYEAQQAKKQHAIDAARAGGVKK